MKTKEKQVPANAQKNSNSKKKRADSAQFSCRHPVSSAKATSERVKGGSLTSLKGPQPTTPAKRKIKLHRPQPTKKSR